MVSISTIVDRRDPRLKMGLEGGLAAGVFDEMLAREIVMEMVRD